MKMTRDDELLLDVMAEIYLVIEAWRTQQEQHTNSLRAEWLDAARRGESFTGIAPKSYRIIVPPNGLDCYRTIDVLLKRAVAFGTSHLPEPSKFHQRAGLFDIKVTVNPRDVVITPRNGIANLVTQRYENLYLQRELSRD